MFPCFYFLVFVGVRFALLCVIRVVRIASTSLRGTTNRKVSRFVRIFASGCGRIVNKRLATRAVPLLAKRRRSLLTCRVFQSRIVFNNFYRLVRGKCKNCVFSGPFTGMVHL